LIGFAKVTRDFTERNRIEHERDLRATEVREQAALLELARDSIIVRDLENRITFWNRGAEAKYGWTKEEALGNATHSFLQTKFPQPLQEWRKPFAKNSIGKSNSFTRPKTAGESPY